jgi:hypothetical protein
MGIAVSLGIFAFGAILGFAVRAHPSGLSVTTVGVIFMVVGAIGFAVSFRGDRWRRHIVEDSIEAGVDPPNVFDDDILPPPRPASQPTDVVVHDSVTVEEPVSDDGWNSATPTAGADYDPEIRRRTDPPIVEESSRFRRRARRAPAGS